MAQKTQVSSVKTQCLVLKLKGKTPLITHRFSEESRQTIEERNQGKASRKKRVRDPEKEWRDCLYLLNTGEYGFPAAAFKKCAVTAVTSLRRKGKLSKIGVRQAFHVLHEDEGLVKIKGTPRQRTDVVRLSKGVADVRYRAEFPEWEVTLEILFNERAISEKEIRSLFALAGFAVGVGDWRPEKGGIYGMFTVA